MNTRLLLNLLMLIGVLVLVAVVVYKPGIEPPAETPPLTNLDADRVSQIRIRQGDDSLNLEKRADGWWIAGEPAVPADPLQVETLLRVTSARPARSYPAGSLELTQLELDPPQTTLQLDDTELRFGATDPLDNLRYVQVGDRVHLIRDDYQQVLQGKRAQLTSRKLLPGDVDITAVQLPDLTLRKQEAGGWSVEPAPEKLSADAAQKLVQAWTGASALWVRSYAKMPDAKPVVIGLADGREIRFELHQAEGETLLGRPDLGLQYQMPEESAKRLLELESEAVAGEAPADEGSGSQAD